MSRVIPRLCRLDTGDADEMLQTSATPFIITDSLEHFPAAHRWTFDFFRKRYGADMIEVSDHIDNPTVKKRVKLRSYVDYLLSPESSPLSRAGGIAPLYPFGYQAFDRHPELLDDIDDPACLTNVLAGLSYETRRLLNLIPGSPAGKWIFIGPKGTVSWLHTDYSAAWLAQIDGHKLCMLFAPEDSPYLYDGAVDPMAPDLERYPDFAAATPWVGEIGPGDTLVMPQGWWHHVVAGTPSITASFNFMNQSNLDEYLVELLRDLPRISDVLGREPELREQLEIGWSGHFESATKAA